MYVSGCKFKKRTHSCSASAALRSIVWPSLFTFALFSGREEEAESLIFWGVFGTPKYLMQDKGVRTLLYHTHQAKPAGICYKYVTQIRAHILPK